MKHHLTIVSRSSSAVVCGALAMLVASCAQQSRLAPGVTTQIIEDETAVADDAGVILFARTNDWPGGIGELDQVTPVNVAIQNRSNRPIRIQYRNFVLAAPDGQRFRAVPPLLLQGSATDPMVASAYHPIEGEFGFVAFEVDPAYREVWPTLEPVKGELRDRDMAYYRRHYSTWQTAPDAEMLARALPEGVLKPGGEVSGFLYFEKLNRDIPRVQLRARVVRPNSGRVVGEARIPFEVDRG